MIARGTVWWAELGPPVGSRPAKRRPVLVVQSDPFNASALATEGKACRKCRGTGYYGRTGLFELMVVTDRIREKVMSRSPAGEVLAAAKADGLKLLREDGWAKVRQGVTTVEEVVRATKV